MQKIYKIKEVEQNFVNQVKGISNTFVFKDNEVYILYNYITGWFISVIKYRFFGDDRKYRAGEFCYYKVENICNDPYINYDKFIGNKTIVVGCTKKDYNIKNPIAKYNNIIKTMLYDNIDFI